MKLRECSDEQGSRVGPQLVRRGIIGGAPLGAAWLIVFVGVTAVSSGAPGFTSLQVELTVIYAVEAALFGGVVGGVVGGLGWILSRITRRSGRARRVASIAGVVLSVLVGAAAGLEAGDSLLPTPPAVIISAVGCAIAAGFIAVWSQWRPASRSLRQGRT